MASMYIYPRQTVTNLVDSDIDSHVEDLEDLYISENGISADDIPRLMNEVQQCYNVQPDDEIQHMPEVRPTEREAEAEVAFEEAINSLNEANVDGNKSWASCSEEKRVENVYRLKKGQHISVPDQLTKLKNILKSTYKYHAIVKNVLQKEGTRVEMVLISSSKENDSIKIYESINMYDLKYDEIYIIKYKHPRYTADEIVCRAESMLSKNSEEARAFSTYNPATRNFKHFAKWCVVGEGQSFQVQGLKNKIINGFRQFFDDKTPYMPERRPTKRGAESAFEKAINHLNDFNEYRTGNGASCLEGKRVENVSTFKRGQHLYIPEKYGRLYLKTPHKKYYSYKIHAIVKDVKHRAGTRVEMVLIHFSKQYDSIKIIESQKTYDLKNDEIYIIEYKHPRYTADEIVRRAESTLPKNGEEAREFSTYNPTTRNCYHIAMWCGVGDSDHFEDYSNLENGTSADNFSLLLDEVRQNYNVHSDDTISYMPERRPTKSEAKSALEDAINDLNDFNEDRTNSCASCSEEKRVENVFTFEKGQHISIPGKCGKLYLKEPHKLYYLYKHHAIVKDVKHKAGTRVEMVLIHFSKENDSIKIYESETTYDLKKDEIYIIEYKHPRYTADEIVRRAESMLSENGEEAREFSTYNLITRNCEHFATWCVVGEGESFQVQGLKNKIINGFRKFFGEGSFIFKGIMRLLNASPEEIAISLTRAINVPEIVLSGSIALYLIYCIIMTALHIRDYKKGHMCWPCLKRKLQDLWLAFGVWGMTSIITYIIFLFALPLMAPAVGIPLVILLVLLSVLLQWSVSKIRNALRNTNNKTAIQSLCELNSGDIASLTYYGIEHLIIVSGVHVENNNFKRGSVRGIHYGLSHLFSTREITEEDFAVDLAKSKVNLYDFRHLPCYSGTEVVSRARKRVGEKKWAIGSNGSDHFCYWAKVCTGSSGICKESENRNLKESETTTLSSFFIEKKEAHLTTDIGIGDVVQFKNTGILVGKIHLDGENGRRCEIKLIVYDSRWYGRCRNFEVDFNKDHVFVRKYHPAHCHPMAVRAERAIEMKDRKGSWWTDQGFIEHCIMLNP